MPPASPRAALLIAALTLPWLWPFTSGPTAATQPYLMAMALAAVALALWPARATRSRRAAGGDGLAGGGGRQRRDRAAAIPRPRNAAVPLVNVAEPRQAFGNLRQPNQLASLLVIGALALRWQVQQGRLARRPAAALLALLMAALAATASRLGLVALLAVLALVWWWARADRIARRSAVATAGRRADGERWPPRWGCTRWRCWRCRGWRKRWAWPRGATCWRACATTRPVAAAAGCCGATCCT